MHHCREGGQGVMYAGLVCVGCVGERVDMMGWMLERFAPQRSREREREREMQPQCRESPRYYTHSLSLPHLMHTCTWTHAPARWIHAFKLTHSVTFSLPVAKRRDCVSAALSIFRPLPLCRCHLSPPSPLSSCLSEGNPERQQLIHKPWPRVVPIVRDHFPGRQKIRRPWLLQFQALRLY